MDNFFETGLVVEDNFLVETGNVAEDSFPVEMGLVAKNNFIVETVFALAEKYPYKEFGVVYPIRVWSL